MYVSEFVLRTYVRITQFFRVVLQLHHQLTLLEYHVNYWKHLQELVSLYPVTVVLVFNLLPW